jgi:phosphomevalonate kinase
MVKVSAPGKLFLSGEWSVLEVGNPGIVAAVNSRVHTEIEEGDFSLTIDDFKIKDLGFSVKDGKIGFERELGDYEKEKLVFPIASIETAARYLGGLKPFRLRSWGDISQLEIDGEARKIGFGSSAASVVSFISGILAFNGVDIEGRKNKDVIYKLSAMAHYFAQGKVGSAFDVAASTYGGVFVYKRFDPKWLSGEMESGKNVSEIAESEWPEFLVEELEIPEGFRLDIGWTKGSASTSAMVKEMNLFRDKDPGEYKRLFDQIANLVRDSIPFWKSKDREKILENLRKNEDFLRELGEKSGVNIETPELKELSELANKEGAAGKLSGAGGGDCGIAVSFDKEVSEKVKEAWKKAGLYLIDVTIDHDGVKAEK